MSITTVTDPGHREALWELEAGFDRGAMLTVFGPCRVEYEGRAASSLSLGRRLVILKPDGAALVHTDEGREPVNWQPPGSRHRATVADGRLAVRSVRSSPDEELRVAFDRVERLAAYPVTGRRGVAVVGTESDLRDRVLREPSLIEPGFEPVATERQTDAGAVDVFGRDADGRPVAVELKRRRVGPDAVGQLARYVASLERADDVADPRGVLVAPSVTDRAADLLAEEGLEHVALDPPEAPLDAAVPSDAPETDDTTSDAPETGDDEASDTPASDGPSVVSDPGPGARTEQEDTSDAAGAESGGETDETGAESGDASNVTSGGPSGETGERSGGSSGETGETASGE